MPRRPARRATARTRRSRRPLPRLRLRVSRRGWLALAALALLLAFPPSRRVLGRAAQAAVRTVAAARAAERRERVVAAYAVVTATQVTFLVSSTS